MLARIKGWINERWPLSDLLRLGLEEEIPGGTSFAYIFGSAVSLTFVIQVVTGI